MRFVVHAPKRYANRITNRSTADHPVPPLRRLRRRQQPLGGLGLVALGVAIGAQHRRADGAATPRLPASRRSAPATPSFHAFHGRCAVAFARLLEAAERAAFLKFSSRFRGVIPRSSTFLDIGHPPAVWVPAARQRLEAETVRWPAQRKLSRERWGRHNRMPIP